MHTLLQDSRFAVRMMARTPVVTLVAVLSLALAIAANGAMFALLNGFLFEPFPYESQEELVLYRTLDQDDGQNMDMAGGVSVPSFRDYVSASPSVVASTLFDTDVANLTGLDTPEQLNVVLATPSLFDVLGVQPSLGRGFRAEEGVEGAGQVLVLHHDFWERRFLADPDVLGRTVTLDGGAYTIVGVMPEGFDLIPADVQAFRPTDFTAELENRASRGFTGIARLRPGSTAEQAQLEVEGLHARLATEHPDALRGVDLIVQPLRASFPGSTDTQLVRLLTAVTLFGLLIACANVANLLLGRAEERQREIAVRTAIGAGRSRILRQMLTESVLMGGLAGAIGLTLSVWVVRWLRAQMPPLLPAAVMPELDPEVVVATLAVSMFAGIFFGMAPALQAASPETVSAVKGESSGKAGRSRMSSALVVVQMAMSLLLLMSSGLFLRSLQSATEIDPGFDEPRNLVMVSVDPGLQGYDTERSRAFWDRMLEQVGSLPEVASVGLTASVPLGLNRSDRGVEIPGYEFTEGERTSLQYSNVSEGYLETLGVRLVEGRTFTPLDDASGPPVIIVNQRFAERFWPGESALGKVVTTAGREREVVGVVETGKYTSLGESPIEFMYLPHRERFQSDVSMIARASGDPQVALRRMQEIVRAADPDMPVYDVRSMEDHMGIALLPARLGGTVLGIFGLLGLTLAAVGIYGVMAYSVAQRKRELGIRVAMGADRRTVLELVLREGLRLALVGTAIGVVGALGAAQLVKGLLYDVPAIDPIAFTLVPGTLLAVAALAVYLPARRAASVDPMRALKAD